jgi:hypothetical protein
MSTDINVNIIQKFVEEKVIGNGLLYGTAPTDLH